MFGIHAQKMPQGSAAGKQGLTGIFACADRACYAELQRNTIRPLIL
jgi:hypothetical protein